MLGSMVLLAFSLQDQIDKYGTYIGIAAFFGLAVLTLLYFAQAREVKRLREWAGHAPERITELEDLIDELRRAPAPAPAVQQAPAPPAKPQPAVAATNGTTTLQPAEVAALAFARSAGVHEPHLPKPHTAPVATVADAEPTEVAAGGAAVATGEPAGAQAVNGGGAGHPPVPRPATPAARRNEPPLPPLPPRRAAAAGNRRPAASPPPREGSGSRAVILTAIVGVLVLGGAVFGITRLMGGDDPVPPRENVVATPGPDEGAAEEEPTATPEPRVTKENALVAVFNTTGVSGLAAGQAELLRQEGYPDANLSTGDAPEPRPTSTVLYERGARSAAAGVAEVLGISDIKQLADDPMAQGLVESSQKKWNVVAIIGADKQN